MVYLGFGFLILAALAFGSWWIRRPAAPQKGSETQFDSAFLGLALFGLDQSFVSIRHVASGQTIRFEKQGPDAQSGQLLVRFVGRLPSEENRQRFLTQLRLLGVSVTEHNLKQSDSEVTVLLGQCSSLDHAICEAIAKRAIDAVGLGLEDLYAVEFEGPKDYRRVDEYFGFRPSSGS